MIPWVKSWKRRGSGSCGAATWLSRENQFGGYVLWTGSIFLLNRVRPLTWGIRFILGFINILYQSTGLTLSGVGPQGDATSVRGCAPFTIYIHVCVRECCHCNEPAHGYTRTCFTYLGMAEIMLQHLTTYNLIIQSAKEPCRL